MGTTILVAFGRAVCGPDLADLGLGAWLAGVEAGRESDSAVRLFEGAASPGEPGLLAGVVLDRIGPEDGFRDLRELRTVPTAAEEARAYRAIKSLPPALLSSRALSPLGILFIRTDDERNGK